MNNSTNVSAAGSSGMGASMLNVDPDKLAQREAAVKKKEKDLQLMAKDLERRKALIEEVEDKQGNMAQREQAAQEQEAANAAALRDIKKRDKIVKDNEAKVEASQAALDAMEQRLSLRDEDIEAKSKRLEAAKIAHEKNVAALEAREVSLRDREAKAMDVELQNRARTVELNRFKESLDARAAELATAEAALAAAQKEVKRRSDANDKEAQQLREKGVALQARDAELNREKESAKALRQQLTIDEKQIRSDRQAAEIVIADSKRRCDIAETIEVTAKKRREEADQAVLALEEEKAKLARARADFAAHEETVQRLEIQCRRIEEDVASREKSLFNEQRELRAREKHLAGQLAVLEETEAHIESQKRDLEDRADAVALRERNVTDREALAAAQLREAAQQASLTDRRQAALDVKEKELVDWMKEMAWREMMLGEQEEVVRRQPVVPILASSHSSAKKATPSSAPSRQDASSPFPPGFGHRAFGHAVVEVQFRRLKDQYVSAQMKHARDQLAYEEELKRSLAQHRSRRPRAGIGISQNSGDLSEEADQVGGIGELEKSVHKLSVSFVRKMATFRAFDGFETPLSPEKITQLSQFDPAETSVLSMAANLEYVLKTVQAFVCAMQTCPLDHKDRAADVQDLVARVSKWWIGAKQNARDTLQQLLSDRQQYLTQALAVLEKHVAVVPEELSSAPWPYGSSVVPENLESRTGKYHATDAFEHVKESTILAPRGLATLKAVSEAAGARVVADGHGAPSDHPASVSKTPLQHKAVADTIGSPSAGVMRSEVADKSDSVFLGLGRLGSARPRRKGDFDLAAFLEDSSRMPPLQHSSPYKVPPVRPASAATGPVTPSKAAQKRGLPPTAPL